ncbi:MAG TPA: apolipoprotein N-acyltransferase [Anaeromyxobacter sp.]|nr:apolipoprotein N-acyltransferase [Anaeromyxobacter sp.]
MRRFLPLAAALVSGLATALSLPLVVPAISIRELDPAGRLELVAFVSLVPAFLALRGFRRALGAALLGLVAGLAYFFAAIYWVSHAMTAFGGLSMGLSLIALTLLVGYMAVHWALAFGVAGHLRVRFGWPLWVVLPPAWAGAELLRNYLFSGFPWADLGYTQVRTLALAQLASLTGVYGIAALVVLVNAVLAELLAAVWEKRPLPRAGPAVAAALLLLSLAYGRSHLRKVREEMAAAPSMEVGLVQPNIDQSRNNSRAEHESYILDRLVGPTLEADRAGADLVVWPEAAYPLEVPPGVASFEVPRAGLPQLTRAHLLLGAPTLEFFRDEEGRRLPRVGNMLFLLDRKLRVLDRYQKIHLVPFGEYVPAAVHTLFPFLRQIVPTMVAVSPGRLYTVLSFEPEAAPAGEVPARAASAKAGAGGTRPADPPALDPVRLAPLICYDAIFPEIVRTFMEERPAPDVLVNSTNDAWYGYSSGPYQFLAIVQMRAIEARRAVIRSAYAGVSALILPTGELAPGALEVGPVDPVLSPDRNEPAHLLLARVPRLRGATVYTRIGDLFAYACVLFTALALGAARLRRPRAPAFPPGEPTPEHPRS